MIWLKGERRRKFGSFVCGGVKLVRRGRSSEGEEASSSSFVVFVFVSMEAAPEESHYAGCPFRKRLFNSAQVK